MTTCRPPGTSTGPRPELAASFQHAGVVEAYRYRPPYPAEVFDVLEGLLRDEPAHVLDLGAGEGALARPLIARGRVAGVDAVDASAAMIAAGRERPGGGHPGLRWLLGGVDEVALAGPYGLATAGASVHWMPWEQTMARLREVLSEQGLFAIIEHGYHRLPWSDDVAQVLARHSRNPGFDPRYDAADELAARGLFRKLGAHRTLPVPFRQSVADYVEQFHSTASLARELMAADEAAEFDEAVARVVRRHAVDGVLTVDIVATLVWGEPTEPTATATETKTPTETPTATTPATARDGARA
ncbi:MAG TPA: class I SAM-dependent methyltransferase [Actinospica sp.]|nr:class I SAM-dependent methyltransferase [Actinospica sp.]